jgi:xanthine dehydrogenase YagR molybdenum-binding subunit
MALQERKKKKIKATQVVDGIEKEVEIEVDDLGGPVWGPNNAHTILNHNIRRVDGPEKVSGQAKYTFDVKLPGMLYGRILRSPYACAEIASLDVSAAEKMNGVKAVITLKEAGKELKYEGDPVAAVAAITPEIAEDAIRAIQVKYIPKPHVVTAQQALRPDAPAVFVGENLKGNARPAGSAGSKADVEAALKTCDAVVSREFEATMQHHACLETHGVVVDYRGGDTATVYASTQGTFTIPGEAAQALGLKGENAVTSVVEYMGGGFGSKFGLDLPGMVACQLSKKAKAPVKLMLSRTDEFLMAGNRSGAVQRVKAGATKDGKLVAMMAEQFRMGGVGGGSLANLPYAVYKVGTVYREMSTLHTHQDAGRAMRAPGHPEASFPMESIIDDLAYAIGMDPVAFRKQNVTDPVYARQLDMGAKAIGWERRPKTPGGGEGYGPNKALKRGMGCALATWGGGGAPGSKADVFIKRDGSVTVQIGLQDLGTGSRTYTAAIVAEELGLPVSQVETRIGRSTYGNSVASGGSITTASVAPVIKDAAFNARNLLFESAARLLGAKPENLVAKDGKIALKDGSKSITWKQACATLGMGGIAARGEWKPGLSAQGVHGAQFAEVEVDTETGQVRVLKMVAVHDCGLPLNRLALESQINGGMIQALGYALTEKSILDPQTGRMLNATLEEYKLPGTFEMPEMIPIIDDGDTREMVIGMAEASVIPGAGAIGNAVYSACGVRVTSLPITPDKILMGLEKLKNAEEEA